MNWIEMYRETVKKLKKKTNNFENAFNMLSEEDQQEVDAVLKEVGVKL